MIAGCLYDWLWAWQGKKLVPLLERRKQRAWDDVVLSKTSRNDLLRRDILMTWVRLLAVTEPNTAG